MFYLEGKRNKKVKLFGLRKIDKNFVVNLINIVKNKLIK